MLNKIQDGKTIKYVPSGSAVISGQFVLVGALAAVAATDIAVGATGICEAEGVFDLPKITGAIAQGVQLYWDADGDPVGGVAGSGALTTSDGSGANSPAGKSWAAAASGDATVRIKINV